MYEKPFMPSPQEEREQRFEEIMEVVREIDPGAQGSLENYVTIHFEDKQEGFVEARLLAEDEAPFSLTLNANTGKPLALLDLKKQFESRGILIAKLLSYFANPDEKRILESFSSPKKSSSSEI